jgi:hypothetical protein
MMNARRICSTFRPPQKRYDGFERDTIEAIYDDIQSFMDEAVAFIIRFFEAIAVTLRKLSNCMLALHCAPQLMCNIPLVEQYFENRATANFWLPVIKSAMLTQEIHPFAAGHLQRPF